MSVDLQAADELGLDLARECLYRFLAAALSDPRGAGFRLVQDSDAQRLACEAADLLRDGSAGQDCPAPSTPALGFGELSPERLTLEPLCEQLQGTVEALQAEFDRVFGLVPSRECPPHETEYHPNAEPFFRAQQMADIAGFYRAFGLEPSQLLPERPDHVALELEFLAILLMKKRLAQVADTPDTAEQVRICDEALRDFFRDHLAWWLPSFATGLRRRAGYGFYAEVGRVLAAWLPLERSRFGVEPPRFPLQPAPAEPPEELAGCGGCSGPS